jgi:hypothetical protein
MSGAPRPGSDGVAENAFPSLSIAATYEVSGAPTPAARPRVARRRELGPGTVVADERAPLLRVRLVHQTADRDVDLVRVAEEALAIGAGQLHRLGVAMQERQRAGAERRDVVALEQVEGHRHERALRPRAACIHIDPAIGRVYRRFDRHAV